MRSRGWSRYVARVRHAMLAGLSALLLATGCTDDGLPDLDTAPAVTGVQSALASAQPNDDLDECPVDDFEELLDDSFELLDDDLIRQTMLGMPASSKFETTTSPAETVGCRLVAESGAVAGFNLLEAPQDLTTFANEFTGLPSSVVTVDINESRPFRGGQFNRVCVDVLEAPELDYCEVNWLDDTLMVSVFVRGAGALDTNLNGLQERFQYVVPIIVERLADS